MASRDAVYVGWKTAHCTEEDLTDDKNALENMKIKIDAL